MAKKPVNPAKQVKSYSQMRKEFYKKYTDVIVPKVMEHEKTRKKKLILAIFLSSISFIAGCFLLYIIITHGGFTKKNEGIIQLSIILYMFSYFSWYFSKKDFENKIKEKIMPTVCSCFGDMKWSEGSYSGGELFARAGIVPEFSHSEYDDIFKGSYKDVHIEIVEPEYEVGSGKHRRTVFNGIIVKLDMNKSFAGHTVIKPNGLIHLSPLSQLHFTELEDPEFNKKFDVYTNNEVDARYLITPSFMERLKNMETAFLASSVSCAFYRKFLIVALKTNKDIFSICSLIKPIDDREQYFRMYEEIVSIIKLIDHFKLSQKIGL